MPPTQLAPYQRHLDPFSPINLIMAFQQTLIIHFKHPSPLVSELHNTQRELNPAFTYLMQNAKRVHIVIAHSL